MAALNLRSLLCAVAALLVLLTLPGCNKNDPASLIGSAKSYLAKSDYNAAIIQLKSALQEAPDNSEARFLLGKTLLEAGDPSGAETEIRKALDLKYPADDAYPVLARALLLQGQSKKLISELGDRKLEQAQARTDLGSSIAIAYLTLGDAKSARAAIDNALAASPKDTRALTVKAQLDAMANDLPAAFKDLEAALAATPNDPEVLIFRARLEISQGRNDDAVKTLEGAIETNPKAFAARLTLVPLLVTSGKLDQAAAQVEAMKKLGPQDFRTLYADALVSFARGDAAHARDAIQQVLAAKPDQLSSVYLSGLINLQLKSFAAAEDALSRVVAEAPGDGGARRALALTYLRTGRPALAIETLGPALQRTSDDALMQRTLGEAYLATGNPAKAAQAYEQANAIDKGSIASKVRLAQARFAAGDTERAFTDLESLSKEDSSKYQADLALIAGHLRRREFAQALAALNTLEQKQPDNPLTYNIKGLINVGMRDLKSARAAYDKALQLQPTNFAAAHSLALIDVQERKPDDARKRYEQMLANDPKNEQLLLALAELLAITRHGPDEVKTAIERAITAAPTSVGPRLTLISLYLQQRDAKAALAAAQSAQAAIPNDPRIVDALGAAQLAAGEANQALETFQRLVQLQPESVPALLRVANAQVTLKNYSAAIDSLHKVLALQPDYAQAWVGLAQIYVVSGRPDDAIAEARKLQKQKPGSALGFAIEAELLANQKKWAEAAAAYRSGLAREPLPALAVRRYIALQNGGRSSEATTMATNWMKEHPRDATLQIFLAQQSLLRKDYRNAVVNLRAAIEIEPNNPLILNNLAWALSELGDPKAIEVAEKAYVQAPYNPSVMDTLGWALVQTGETGRGTELLRSASNLAPSDNEIRLHLAKGLLKSGDKTAARRELETLTKLDQGSPIRADAEKLLTGL